MDDMRGGAANGNKDQVSALANRIRDTLVGEASRYGDRLPSERALCEAHGTSRHQIRAALRRLEEMGLIWRHVGRGTFVGARPVINLGEVEYLAELVSPEQLITVRMCLEPEIAHLAALHAAPADCARLMFCEARCRAAVGWPEYEAWDNNLHHAIARASGNKLFQHFFETVNVLRRSTRWRAPRRPERLTADYTSFRQHAEIVSAISRSDGPGARDAMRVHLASVGARIAPLDGRS
jgi:DNA-binding FadR family transcriptional regulator